MEVLSFQAFGIIILTMILAVLGIGWIGWLYRESYPREISHDFEVLRHLHMELLHGPKHDPNTYMFILGRYFEVYSDIIPDSLNRRQNFWTSYIQFALSLFVVVFITILLLLKIVTAEAGLPILAAFGGAALSQGINSASGSGSGNRSRVEPPVIGRREA